MFLRRHRTLFVSLTAAVALATPVLVPSANAVSISAAVPAAASGTVVTSIATGFDFTCAVLKSARVKC